MTKQEFTQKYWADAVKATRNTGLFPDTLITQAALESGWGKSSHAQPNVNNFFGLKASPDWGGQVISSSTWEYYNGNKTRITGTGKIYNSYNEAIAQGADKVSLFRVFPTAEAGFRGWVDFLKKYSRYEKAGVFSAKSPEEQFAALKAAGYATDPGYVDKLVGILGGIKNLFFEVVENPVETVKKKPIVLVAGIAIITSTLVASVYLWGKLHSAAA